MSYFISPIEAAGLSEMPPESNVIPLPTSTTVPRAFRGACSPTRNTGGRALPALTPSSPPIFSFWIARLSRIRNRNPPRAARALASRASSIGPRSLPGVLPTSRIHPTAPATASASRAARAKERALRPGGGTTVARAAPPDFAFFDL